MSSKIGSETRSHIVRLKVARKPPLLPYHWDILDPRGEGLYISPGDSREHLVCGACGDVVMHGFAPQRFVRCASCGELNVIPYPPTGPRARRLWLAFCREMRDLIHWLREIAL
jgi:hypothetical protein